MPHATANRMPAQGIPCPRLSAAQALDVAGEITRLIRHYGPDQADAA